MIYFDNAATTKPSASALKKAEIYNDEQFFNPSALYQGGLSSANAIKSAKEYILKTIGASTSEYEVVFTSCGSESDNQAIFCAVKRGFFVTDKGEHSAVFKCFCELKNRGIRTELIDLNPDGSINEQKLFQLAEKEKIDFVSIVHVNNETGAVNDINRIADKLKEINPRIVFHSDGVQAYGKMPYKLGKNIDLYSLSAHKINGLKGSGALIKRKKQNLAPLVFGGGQEGGLRSGTENLFGIKVFENAARERFDNLEENFKKAENIKNYIENGLDKEIFSVLSGKKSSPYILTVSAKGLRGEVLMHTLETFGIIVGNGSACASKNRYSRVIEACGYKNDVLDGVVRLSFSPENTIEEADRFVKIFNESASKLKRIMQK